MTTTIDRDEIIEQVTRKLADEHSDRTPGEVERVAREELDALADSRVQDFLLVLTERATKARLQRDR